MTGNGRHPDSPGSAGRSQSRSAAAGSSHHRIAVHTQGTHDRHAQTRRQVLPAYLTSFIGREHEVEELGRLLRSARLVTLVGPGGVGKTRLALHVAADRADSYGNGVWFVDLAPVSDPLLVGQAIATVLG